MSFIQRAFCAALFICLAAVTGCSSSSSSPSAPQAVAPAITTQPLSASVYVGDTATFTVAGTGTPAPTYQWSRGGTAIPGANAASYTTAALLATDSGSTFTCTLSNSAGSVVSSAATLTVSVKAPTIATAPAALTVSAGASATFSVTATGSAPLTYQWLRNGTAIAGATSASYTLAATALTDSGALFSVTVANSAGSVTSATAALTVNAVPVSITAQPASITVTVGTSATFSVTASGTAPITYQWMRGGVAIGGATSASYTLASPQLTDTGAVFSVAVTNSANSVTSANATLTVNPVPISITTQPAAITQFVGETATFTVVAAGTSPTYMWRKNAAAIAGATSATYTTPALAATDDQSVFDVVVSNSAGSVTSTPLTLRVGPFATTYTTQQGVLLNMYAWPGTKNAFLTRTAAYSPVYMRRILTAADGTWNYYAGAVGALPSVYFNYNGLATIANTGVGGVNLCGDGCTFIGATGMEVSDQALGWLYSGVQTNIYDQVIFYEFGRSFWLFNNQIAYKSPADSSCEVTGFAVLMRYRSILAQGYTGTFGGVAANYTSQYNNSLGMIDTYAANTNLNFNNTFLTNSFTSPYGGCADLWASMVLRLAQKYGGETFIQALFKDVLLRPATTTTQDAIDNFVLAASAAAGKNLTLTFGTTWRWPISTAASQEAQSKYGSPQ